MDRAGIVSPGCPPTPSRHPLSLAASALPRPWGLGGISHNPSLRPLFAARLTAAQAPDLGKVPQGCREDWPEVHAKWMRRTQAPHPQKAIAPRGGCGAQDHPLLPPDARIQTFSPSIQGPQHCPLSGCRESSARVCTPCAFGLDVPTAQSPSPIRSDLGTKGMLPSPALLSIANSPDHPPW